MSKMSCKIILCSQRAIVIGIKTEGTMPKAKLNPMVSQMNDKLDDVFFHILPGGEATTATRPAEAEVEWTEAQKAQQESFDQATAYARAAMAEPDVRATYEKLAAKEHKRPFALAFSDYFRGNDLLSKK
jgi:hypothetical protein